MVLAYFVRRNRKSGITLAEQFMLFEHHTGSVYVLKAFVIFVSYPLQVEKA
ncbi:hypothetical protein HMPREF1235_0685 [Streptococcus pyogenes GA41208]|nr:hypothetical protein HMPREF1235_0685 [Streptococcus pyogenes GA41208]